jgi:hypothetical protein
VHVQHETDERILGDYRSKNAGMSASCFRTPLPSGSLALFLPSVWAGMHLDV